MPSLAFHRGRRAAFLERFGDPVLLFAGGMRSRNYPDNVYDYRADSSFLYFFDRPEPGSAALFDPADGSVRLFAPERTAQTALWHGPEPAFDELREIHGVTEVLAVEQLEDHVRKLVGDRPLKSLAVADHHTTARARRLTGEDLSFESPDGPGDPALCDVLFDLRVHKEPEEIERMRETARVTRDAHVAAMAATRAGGTEHQLNGIVTGVFSRAGCTSAYPNILSVRGEILHNNQHRNELRSGDLVLLDAGAEGASGHCSDVTRTWPVDGTFSCEQAEVYEIVLAAELASIEAARVGARFRDVHRTSARVIADGLVQMGILKGDPDGLVEQGVHAAFFPHGVGHMIGIDVHDMEGFGDRVHYPAPRTRSDQFGTRFLRMDRDLEAGHVFTIEPGIYFVPAILNDPELKARFGDAIDHAAAEKFTRANDGRGFGGIRIEDDVWCTPDGPVVLTDAVPKTRADVEAAVGSHQPA